MDKKIPKIENDVQDRKSLAWQKLCDYVDKVEEENRTDFCPAEELGYELFSQIHTLPETISNLKNVKKLVIYGSKIRQLPPQIGEMEALENFIPYTSYDLHWYPYEITKCSKLISSTVSTRALYGNKKNRMAFLSLEDNPVRYFGDTVDCSVCGKSMTYEQTNQLWISLWVGTDVLPLLANLCSKNVRANYQNLRKIIFSFPIKEEKT
jgi:Leucine-rich repeat (LRR) protein